MHNKYIHDSPFAGKGFYNFETSAQLPRHRWYYFKEGFSSALVQEAISTVVKNKRREINVLDPFCGSGTTPLTAALFGHQCTAIEVNPFLSFVAQVKATPQLWRRKQYEENLSRILRSSRRRSSHLENFSTFSQRAGLKKWLFNKDVLCKVTSILNAINVQTPVHNEAFTLAALVAAFECCNVKRDGKALRYKKDWKKRKYAANDVVDKFKEHARIMIDDVERFPIAADKFPRIINSDSRTALSTLEDSCYDLVVTSPPYLNSFDYSDVYRPELFLANYVKDNKELSGIRLKTLRSHIQVDWPRETSVECDLLTPILNKLNTSDKLWSARIPLMVNAYFDDLNKIINVIVQKLRRGGQIWLVVSTSAYGGVHIPVDLILAELANESGLALEGIHRLRDLRTSAQQYLQLNTKLPPLRESLIILRKA
jgi:hypothetical protein